MGMATCTASATESTGMASSIPVQHHGNGHLHGQCNREHWDGQFNTSSTPWEWPLARPVQQRALGWPVQYQFNTMGMATCTASATESTGMASSMPVQCHGNGHLHGQCNREHWDGQL